MSVVVYLLLCAICNQGWAVLINIVLEKILQYNYIPTIGVADLQAPLNNMLQSS